jgi:hypothetical protein
MFSHFLTKALQWFNQYGIGFGKSTLCIHQTMPPASSAFPGVSQG